MFNSLDDARSLQSNANTGKRIVHFDVYVDHASDENRRMINRLRDALRECVGKNFRVDMIPVHDNRELVEADRVIVTPTFIRRFPAPERRAIGTGDPWRAILPTIPDDTPEPVDPTDENCEVAVIASDRYVESLIDGILLLNSDGVIEDANPIAEKLFQQSRDEMIGEHFFFPTPTDSPPPTRVRVLASPDSIAEVKLLRTKRDDQYAWIVLLRDVTAFSLAEEKALADVERRDNFLAALSHELRNPLAAMTNAVQLMEKWESPEPNYEAVRGVISRQCKQMSRIIDDLLQFSQSWRSEVQITSEPVSVRAMLNDVAQATRSYAEHKGVRLKIAPVNESLFVSADADRLHQSTVNLCRNAVRYTPEGGNVTLQAESKGRRVLISVVDDGIGIAQDKLEEIFEPFFQVEPRSGKGMGLGLALVKRFVELMGGSVVAESEGPGKGSKFSINLAKVAGQVIPDDSKQNGVEPTKHRIVLIDDSPDIIQMLKSLLEIEGHEVVTAADGESGVALISSIKPDLALVDIGLPDIDGFEVAMRVKSSEARNTRLVAVSGYGQEDDLRRCKSVGFADHVLKPITLQKLRDVIEKSPVQS